MDTWATVHGPHECHDWLKRAGIGNPRRIAVYEALGKANGTGRYINAEWVVVGYWPDIGTHYRRTIRQPILSLGLK